MAQQIINIGQNPNDGTGDKIRDAFSKVNTNFTELYDSNEYLLKIIDDIRSSDFDFDQQIININQSITNLTSRLTALEAESVYFNNPMVLDYFYISDLDFANVIQTEKKTLLIKEIGSSLIDLYLQWSLSGDTPTQVTLQYGSRTINVSPKTTTSYWVPNGPFTSNTTFTLTAKDQPASSLRQITHKMTTELKFFDRVYWGVTQLDYNSFVSGEIFTNQYVVSDLTDRVARSVDYDASVFTNGGYLFYAYPKRNTYEYTLNNVTVEGMAYSAYKTKDISITNQYGLTMTYTVVIFDFIQRGDNIEVTFL